MPGFHRSPSGVIAESDSTEARNIGFCQASATPTTPQRLRWKLIRRRRLVLDIIGYVAICRVKMRRDVSWMMSYVLIHRANLKLVVFYIRVYVSICRAQMRKVVSCTMPYVSISRALLELVVSYMAGYDSICNVKMERLVASTIPYVLIAWTDLDRHLNRRKP